MARFRLTISRMVFLLRRGRSGDSYPHSLALPRRTSQWTIEGRRPPAASCSHDFSNWQKVRAHRSGRNMHVSFPPKRVEQNLRPLRGDAHTAGQCYLDRPLRVVQRIRRRHRPRQRRCRRHRLRRHGQHFNTRELCPRPGRGPERSFQQMSPPRVEQATADAIAARHRDRRYARLQTLRRNLPLLLDRPTSSPLAARDYLDPLTASAHTSSRMSALYFSSRFHRLVVHLHGQHASHRHRVAQCGFNATLTDMYDGHMAQGQIVATPPVSPDNNWTPAQQSPLGQLAWTAACGISQ